jgi:hypothetical protein
MGFLCRKPKLQCKLETTKEVSTVSKNPWDPWGGQACSEEGKAIGGGEWKDPQQ